MPPGPDSRIDERVSELAIEVRGLEKRFGRRPVLRGVDLEVPAGSAFGLVGPNGAGKTTFIKLLLGIARPSSGTAQLFGQDPAQPSARRGVGYLPERLTLPGARSPRAHLRVVAGLVSAQAEDVEARLDEVGLEPEARGRRMRGFSKGMKQRVGLATALVGDPRLLILDEPTDGVDPMGRVHIRELLAARVRAGTTVFLNSHLLSETERLCDRVAVLGDGQILASGALTELGRRGAPTARFDDHPELERIARKHGLEPGPGGWIVGRDPRPEAMFRALAGALAEGLVLLDLTQPADDLEAILKQAVALGEGGS